MLQRAADQVVLAEMAARDLAGRKARAEWRTPATVRNRGFAKRMRSLPTEAERRLWQLLRGRRFEQFKFRRQVPIGPYIVDLVCAERGLIIELDGSQHADNERDVLRDRWLVAQGYRTLRIWNNDMLARPDAVIDTIFTYLQEQKP